VALAEFGEWVERASPGNSSVLECDEHGAQQTVDEECCAEWKEDDIPGGDSAETASQTVEQGDCREGDESGDTRCRPCQKCNGGEVEEGQPGAGDQEK